MAEQPDVSKGWCCNGKTWTEHAHESADGECCQPEGTQINDLDPEAREKAQERLGQSS